ncbi:hypothetical protein [Pseudomonas sp.]|uniref:hypothetical protein n=1 Tax=Pseudomonas sp. TaxID=306 RepID=UPI00258AC3B0|nr:hypothetical protein [Pseudomonas sp.]
MSDVKRYDAGNMTRGEVVLAADYDALAADVGTLGDGLKQMAMLCAEAEKERDALAQRCRELEDERADLWKTVDSYEKHSSGIHALAEIERLRAEVERLIADNADLKAQLLEAERGAEELVRLRAEMRDLIGRLKNIVTNPCESKEALAFRVAHLLEQSACATTDGATPAA